VCEETGFILVLRSGIARVSDPPSQACVKRNFSFAWHIGINTVDDQEVFAAVGEEGFARLVGAFYRKVPQDEVLGRLYPLNDLAGAEQRLRDFLIFRFGGPPRYIEQRGHPRLRMRHAPYPVDRTARDHWLQVMQSALTESRLPDEVKQILWTYFESTADFMINKA
jgi:hemoglobin